MKRRAAAAAPRPAKPARAAARQPHANPAVSAMLSSRRAAPPESLAPEQLPALDWKTATDLDVVEHSKLSYRLHLDDARSTILDVMENSDDMRARLAAAKEVNDQAGLPRKFESPSGDATRVPVGVLADAFAILRTMLNPETPPMKRANPSDPPLLMSTTKVATFEVSEQNATEHR